LPGERLAQAVADICDAQRLDELVREHGVEVMVHAAAYQARSDDGVPSV
jgi:FlaA1/EpsC-like NDP-sugar epimerase